jgi:TPR repeat protein
MRKHILLAAAFPLLLSSQSWADFSEGTQAYDRGNYLAAMNELHPLAEQGLASAQFYLGLMYENGQSVQQDYQEAARWYLKAANQGHDGAQNNLGKLYEEGQGVEQDHIIAVQWYQKAADQGLSAAQFNLAEMYMNGRGVRPNTDQAQVWYRKAAAQGHRKAIAELRQFPEPPTPVETPKIVEPPEKVESPENVEPPEKVESLKKADSSKKVQKNITPKADEPRDFERTVRKCTKEVQRAFPSDHFDAYSEGTKVRFIGTPEANFKFQKCMSRNGHPLVSDK